MSQKKTTRVTTVQIEITGAGLTAQEEQVLRLRRGIAARATHPLELKATPTSKARDALLALERQVVYEQQLHDKKRAERKSKIVNTLRSRKR